MKKTLKKHLNKKGLTLLEVIITIAIVSIIIPVAFSVLGFGNKTFNSGISRRDIQQNVRNISTVMVDEIRYEGSNQTESVDEIYLVDKIPSESNRLEKIKYIAIEETGLKIYVGKSPTPSTQLGDNNGINFEKSSIERIKEKNETVAIKIKVVGEESGNSYEVETAVYPLNGEISSGEGLPIIIEFKGE
ncbi:hypothetical protein EUAN_11080 [Andreesenia angusta]|uniref:Prepilin-type N-terminal cleavage/methylation domain-containing protein n=1 Tax=Andreesenia angusta TaxID=39480 RepID=A0A1S1V7G8_9FIRM|nr:prepilin-type N-terminal cleavage/methylation domain-containing protein [Andreesenia angusta]OHW62543.1 hypothetical protein EUAN_11080 [Andreesenia angusta]